MDKMVKIKNKIISFALTILMTVGLFADIVPGMVITAEAKTNFNILLWSPYKCTTSGNGTDEWIASIKDCCQQAQGISINLQEKVNNTVLTTSDLAGVDLVFILPANGQISSLLGEQNVNVQHLQRFVNVGGRIIMNGEHPNFSSSFNRALSDLASELGGNFSIGTEAKDLSSETVMTLNTAEKPSLTQGCENIRPNAFADIASTNTKSAIWVMKDKDDKVFAMDQAVGKGYITAISDINWISSPTGDAKTAATQFLTNLLVDSSQNMEEVSKPTITGPQDLEWEEGDNTQRTLSVTASASNGGTLSYQWYKGTSADFTPGSTNIINGATGASYTIPSPESMEVGNYYYKCIVTSTVGTSNASRTSDAATVTVKERPVEEPVITGPGNLEWFEGDPSNRKLSVTVTGTNLGDLTYQWHRGTSADFKPSDTNKINGETAKDYTIPSPETMNVGTYYYKCVVTSTKGTTKVSATSNAATVTVKAVQPDPPIEPKKPVIMGPQNLEWYEGDGTSRTLSVTAAAEDGGILTYQWYEGYTSDFEPGYENIISGATGSDYFIPAPGTMAIGNYYYKCVVTNTIESASAYSVSNVATITVKPLLPGQPVISGPQNLEWYEGDNMQRRLMVTARADNVGTMTYQWYKGSSADFVPGNSSIIEKATRAAYSIPNPGKMSAGSYYYKCVVTNTRGGEKATSISKAATVTVKTVETVTPEPQYDSGAMEVDVEKRENTPDVAVRGLTEEIAWAVATDEEKNEISKGTNGKLWLEITNIDNSVSADDRQKVEQEGKVLNDATVGMYLDFSMYFQLGKGYKRKISELNGKSIKATVTVPANLLTTEKKRTYYLVSVHNGVLRIHGSSISDKINATIYDFSTYAIIYSDEDEPVLQANIKIEQTHDKIIVRWDKIRDVGKVDLFLQYCGKKYSKKPTKTTKSRKVTITTIKGKKINQTKNYKMYLVAYDSSGKRIGKTLSCHFAGKFNKYTNPKKLKLSTKQLTVSVGQSARIKGSIKYEDPKKKALSTKHAPRYRYVSDVPEIAAVDKNGNITGLSPGTCDVYVCCQNGMSKFVSVTVTE
ncbi:hypothetical protein [Butyrivibrio sp. LC3010]|uniref:hypothetical protein n=1 Tax=Butyrivibrio sp. LC3010 TaxID=1280680 RepID=UPI000424A33C|nr:hypothetical protein [Butyrivibrio sp. LC3010]